MTKLKIKILPGFESEKEYILDIIIVEYLGLDYELIVDNNSAGYELAFPEGKLVFEDSFFRKVENSTYLENKYLPTAPELMNNEFVTESDLPIIFGGSKIEKNNNSILCNADIFASSFFMLTGWEEIVKVERDKHQRFPASASHSFINNYLHRPIVNEYTELLWNLLVKAGYKGKRKENKYKLVITHDVDFIIKWRTFFHFAKSFMGDLIRRKSLGLAFRNTKWYFNYLKNKKKDPYDCLDELMDLSEQVGNKSHFFFIPGGNTKYEKHYKISSEQIKSSINEIIERKHYCGIHPSYNSYNNVEMLKTEKESLEEICKSKILFGRQHYLRFSIPETWQSWEDAEMEWDSSLYYTYNFGFRTGTCLPYSVFNINTKKKLKLKEKTLSLMDVSLFASGLNEDVEKAVFEQINRVKKYKGEYVILWHNSNLNTEDWKKLKGFYCKILNYADDRKD